VSPTEARRASHADIEVVTDIITLAFANDPLWSRAMERADGRTDHHREFWRLFVEGAIGYEWIWIAGDGEAAAIWVPPGGSELNDEQTARLEELIDRHLGAGGPDYREVTRRFEEAHPHAEPHYYLTLLATHPDHRSKGVGMRLLADGLSRIDAEHLPAYLESTNPANNKRYRSVGFEPIGSFTFPGDGPEVTTMWRPAR
jgi:ribosomal protein S18 acetylase RimI-like enzyme